jgi:hypothetical protein
MVTPTYAEKPLKIPLHAVITFLKMIEEHKQTEKLAEAAKSKNAFVTVDPETVNFVKDYLVENNLHEHPIAQHVVNARGLRAQGDRFDCDFGRS